jgi:Tfp pilus assembly ATPase PilU
MSNSMDDASQTFEQALFKLYQEGKVELDQALKHADSPTNLYWLINHSGVQEVDMPEVDENSVDFSMHRQSTGKKPKMKSSGDKHAHS